MPEQIIPKITVEQANRFWSNVQIGKETECWPWKKFRNRFGYGMVSITWKKVFIASRIAYFLSTNHDPRNFCVLHKCDNPCCCNPIHLFLGTRNDNNVDRKNKGRSRGLRGESCHMAKLTNEIVQHIRHLRQSGHTLNSIAKQFSVTKKNIHFIVTRQTWRDVA